MVMVDTLSQLMAGATHITPVIYGDDGKPLPQQPTASQPVTQQSADGKPEAKPATPVGEKPAAQ